MVKGGRWEEGERSERRGINDERVARREEYTHVSKINFIEREPSKY